jgi:carboxypeptidase Taq
MTNMNELEHRYAEIQDLRHGLNILGWDQQVMMPQGGATARAHTLATLTGLAHQKITDPQLRKLVRSLSRKKDLPRARRRTVELVKREVDKASAVPSSLAKDMAHAESQGLESWQAAREAKDFKRFASDLSRMVDLKREVARLTAGRGRLYDALLDDFEPGATVKQIDPLLGELKAVTVPLLESVVASRKKVDLRPFVGRFDVSAQESFARAVALSMGIDPDRSRMDRSTHPFCGGTGPNDVRMTARYDQKDTRGGLFGVIHEAGHGLYEQGLDARRLRTPLGGAISMAIHESQSRLWENNVARSRPFWKHWLPKLRRAHPQLKGVPLDAVWAAANVMKPSMIRVEADELTYNLHIILRYEIERDLIEGQLEVKELPDRWNAAMHDSLGITPRHDSEGVLQDIHWSMGLFGYFPTYSIGNLYAAQFMEAARKGIRGLDGKIAAGNMAPLRAWLQDKIHRHDQLYTAAQTVKRVTGKPLGIDAFRTYITKKVRTLYG